VVHILELAYPKAEKRESMILGIEFLTPDQLRAERDSLETWSQICVDNLEKLLEGRRQKSGDRGQEHPTGERG
jgi:hypothetical protein